MSHAIPSALGSSFDTPYLGGDEAEETMVEWAKIERSLQKADDHTRLRFCLCLQIIGLSLLGDYDNSFARGLLARDMDSMLGPLQVEGDLKPGSFDYHHAHHVMSLVRSLIERLQSEQECLDFGYDPAYSAMENQKILAAIIEVEGECSIENIDITRMHEALSRSRLTKGERLRLQDVSSLTNTCRSVLEGWVLV